MYMCTYSILVHVYTCTLYTTTCTCTVYCLYIPRESLEYDNEMSLYRYPQGYRVDRYVGGGAQDPLRDQVG